MRLRKAIFIMKKFIPGPGKPDKIKTINRFTEFQLKEKNSVFLGHAYPIESKEDAEQTLLNVRKQFHDAAHHCFAYKLLGSEFRYSDDGEPSGSAGIRIFNAIEHFNLVNVMVIIIRYFGGTKLGVGPLGKAYYKTAVSTLQSAPVLAKLNYSKFSIIYKYEDSSRIHKILSKYDALEIKSSFHQYPVIEACIPLKKRDNFETELRDILKDTGDFTILMESVYL